MTTQATLELVPGPKSPNGPQGGAVDSPDSTGFDIGWDHARHALVPPPELLLEGTPIGQGWRAARAVFGRRTLPAPQATRQWLALRTQAWREGIAFERQQVTPHYLAQLQVTRCPVLRTALGGAPGQPDAAVFERLNPHAAFAAGNLVMMSRGAAQARAGVDLLETLRRARRAECSGETVEGLDAGAWWRLAALRACAMPLPFHEAARLPLAVLPPNRVRLLNPAQGLQALVTLLFTTPGWSGRTRALAALLPEHTVRHDFNLFVGALAPRVLEAGPDTVGLRRALENAWLQERVQRRWQHFVLSLGEAATAALLERATADGLTAVRTVSHPLAQATDGWGLAEGGRVRPVWRGRLPAMRQPASATTARHFAC
ncbi:MAG: hypothetical protein Q8K45_00300 [Rubrivivax sp.]|nr:hypothetical protein [Rubrivivax sp.]